MSILYQRPSLFAGPPPIPQNITGILKYEIQSNAYYKRLKNVTWLFLEIIASILILGIIWINVDWVRITVTVIAIAIAVILLLILNRIFY